ncbi:zinc ribbon domain-containing protein [Acetobacterium carbinolicum]|jgi:hypothetical protein|uniref:zinc ribbon domain-containing protein n=1 Tax=Acetobacterium TaxID=33951 RepID=UPI000DBEB6DB|nr:MULTISPECIES: zinc ribbon domain-containing protein [unclassified Acetobacterium]AWW28107.1 hypothetical protein DOZ58_16480 [Acetobacterium sp. KB-1]MDK2941189.1 hypothetical protein [Acetobacterium sp.]MDZ5726051.1 hypothetical protein [Acetobacterium sp. K1/6]
MAYCPKCGVEVEDDVKCCPLCDFPIPDVNEGNYPHDAKYPQAINTYDEDHLGKKNKAFFSLTIIAISIMVIIGVIYLVYPWNHELLKYIALADLSIFAIVFFAMGYLQPNYNFLGAYITVVVTCLLVFLILGSQSNWFLSYAFPIATLVYLDISLFRFVLKHTRHKSQFIFIPSNLILFVIVLAIGIDGIISINVLGSIHLTWSLIVAVSGICIIVLLQTIYHRIPEKTRRMLKNKMHV